MTRRTFLPGFALTLAALAYFATRSLCVLEDSRRAAAERLASDSRPIEREDSGYVSSRTCRACHPHEYSTWQASYHRSMTQVATPDSVVGDFDGVELPWQQSAFRLERRGDEFWVSDAKDRSSARQIVMTTGSHHYQLYWYGSGRGRKVLPVPFVWLIEEREWLPRGAAFLVPAAEAANVMANWNRECIQCHSTHGRPRIDERGQSIDTDVGELGIACEACHGPGEEHVRENRDPWRRYRQHLGDAPDPSIVQPARLSAHLSSEVCGQCHGMGGMYSVEATQAWLQHGFPYRPGRELADTILSLSKANREHPVIRQLLAADPTYLEGRFWSDGMPRVSGREYNGLLETPCHTKGELGCLSCHVMHERDEDPRSLEEWANDQLGSGMGGNAACVGCHDSYVGEALAQHTHHAPGSSGSECYNCHMPYTTYGLLKAIRSHQIDSPSVAVSLATGRPNACNQCHLDRSLGWAADRLEDWYGIARPALGEEEEHTAASILWLLRGDAGQRALMAWSLGWDSARAVSGTEWMAPYLAELLDDPYEAVRYIARRSLRRQPGFEAFDYDIVGPREERIAARQRAVSLWEERQSAGKGPSGDAILVDSGRLRRTDVERLLRKRDDHRMALNE